jgi:hypothetical protein
MLLAVFRFSFNNYFKLYQIVMGLALELLFSSGFSSGLLNPGV